MYAENKPGKYVWLIILVLSLFLLVVTSLMLFLSGGQDILENGLIYAGSPLDLEEIDEAGLGYLNMGMLKPLWEEIWIGIFGIYCAVSLKQGRKYAWSLSLMWGIMLIIDAAVQGGYELFLLDWPQACMQTYLFLVIGTVSVASLLFTKRGYSNFQPRSQS